MAQGRLWADQDGNSIPRPKRIFARHLPLHCDAAVVIGRAEVPRRSGLYGILIKTAAFSSRIYMPVSPNSRLDIRRVSMLDVIFIAAGCALVAVAIAYTYACERL